MEYVKPVLAASQGVPLLLVVILASSTLIGFALLVCRLIISLVDGN